jgi:hypothetical protein
VENDEEQREEIDGQGLGRQWKVCIRGLKQQSVSERMVKSVVKRDSVFLRGRPQEIVSIFIFKSPGLPNYHSSPY